MARARQVTQADLADSVGGARQSVDYPLKSLEARRWPPVAQAVAAVRACRHAQEYRDDPAGGTVLLVTVPASGSIVRNSGTRNGAGWLP